MKRVVDNVVTAALIAVYLTLEAGIMLREAVRNA